MRVAVVEDNGQIAAADLSKIAPLFIVSSRTPDLPIPSRLMGEFYEPGKGRGETNKARDRSVEFINQNFAAQNRLPTLHPLFRFLGQLSTQYPGVTPPAALRAVGVFAYSSPEKSDGIGIELPPVCTSPPGMGAASVEGGQEKVNMFWEGSFSEDEKVTFSSDRRSISREPQAGQAITATLSRAKMKLEHF